MASPKPTQITDLRELFQVHGQSQVFRFWETLDDRQRAHLLAQAERIGPELPSLLEGHRRALEALSSPTRRDLSPPDAICLPEFGGDPQRFESARQRGLALLGEGRVGAFVVAGGQGSRLGFPGPKGAFPVGPISSRSLFEIQAQKIRGLSRRSGCPVPWYVMTSDSTDEATRALFDQAGNFGLPERDVFIFRQAMVPAFDFDGKLMLSRPDQIFESPNGHGGSLTALADSGALDDMAARGIDRLFYYQVDNPLVRMCDPVYLGFHEEAQAEMSCKVFRKTDPDEKVGILAQVESRLELVEYTELEDAQRHLRDEKGNLVFWAGSPAIHVFNTDFIARVAADAQNLLPIHVSAKKIPLVDDQGEPVDVTEANGYKLERFVFDALPSAKQCCLLEVRRQEEFSPIKNAEGADSPDSSRNDLIALYRAWLDEAGCQIGGEKQGDGTELLEIDHSAIDSAEEAVASGFKNAAEAGDVIRVATGKSS